LTIFKTSPYENLLNRLLLQSLQSEDIAGEKTAFSAKRKLYSEAGERSQDSEERK
jgi:hypothetical protein